MINALAPEASPDGTSYHLGLLAQYHRQHGFGAITTSIYANFPQGLEMLFFMAYPFAKHSAMVHTLFLFSLAIGMVAYGRRFGLPVAGVTGALLFFLIPVVGREGTSAYVDVGLAVVLFACFYLMEIWELERKPALLVPIGLLAGFAYAVKYMGGPAIVYVIAYVLWRLRGRPARAWRGVLLTILPALAMMLPWVLKNIVLWATPFLRWVTTGFPILTSIPHLKWSLREYFRATLTGQLSSYPLRCACAGPSCKGFWAPCFLRAGFRSRPLPILMAGACWPLRRSVRCRLCTVPNCGF